MPQQEGDLILIPLVISVAAAAAAEASAAGIHHAPEDSEAAEGARGRDEQEEVAPVAFSPFLSGKTKRSSARYWSGREYTAQGLSPHSEHTNLEGIYRGRGVYVCVYVGQLAILFL